VPTPSETPCACSSAACSSSQGVGSYNEQAAPSRQELSQSAPLRATSAAADSHTVPRRAVLRRASLPCTHALAPVPHVCSSCMCSAARASLFTGFTPAQTSVHYTLEVRLGRGLPLLPALQRHHQGLAGHLCHACSEHSSPKRYQAHPLPCSTTPLSCYRRTCRPLIIPRTPCPGPRQREP
jgi:hypothetical protein